MGDIESLIAGSEKLTRIYGRWPTFHDAEVIELHHWRGRMKPGRWDDSNVLPVLTVKIHIFIESPTSHHTLATLRFDEVDDFKTEGFNHQNAVLGLSVAMENRSTPENSVELPAQFAVTFQAAHGMSATFRCCRITVVDAVRCTDEGEVWVA